MRDAVCTAVRGFAVLAVGSAVARLPCAVQARVALVWRLVLLISPLDCVDALRRQSMTSSRYCHIGRGRSGYGQRLVRSRSARPLLRHAAKGTANRSGRRSRAIGRLCLRMSVVVPVIRRSLLDSLRLLAQAVFEVDSEWVWWRGRGVQLS